MKLNKNIKLLSFSTTSFYPTILVERAKGGKLKIKNKQRSSIYKKTNWYIYQIKYLKIQKYILLILLSEYLANFLKNYIVSSKIKVNVKLVYKLEKNINILGKYLSKELINNPRQFKNLFKKFTKND